MKTWQLVEGQGYRFLDVPEPTPVAVQPAPVKPTVNHSSGLGIGAVIVTVLYFGFLATLAVGAIELAVFIW
jgi:hypothetical protein